MRIQKFEHDASVFSDGDNRIAIDVGCLTSKPSMQCITAVNTVLISHEHPDHFSIEHLQQLSAARVMGPPSVVAKLAAKNIAATPLEIGSSIDLGSGCNVLVVPADHGPNVPMPYGENLGFIISGSNGAKVYFAGDLGAVPTGLTLPADIHAVMLPLGTGEYVFTPDQAADFIAGRWQKQLVVPMHSPTPDQIASFSKRLKDGLKIRELTVGEEIEVNNGND